MELELNRKIADAVTSFKYLVTCFDNDEGPEVNVKVKMGEGFKYFGAMKMNFAVRSISFGVKW